VVSLGETVGSWGTGTGVLGFSLEQTRSSDLWASCGSLSATDGNRTDEVRSYVFGAVAMSRKMPEADMHGLFRVIVCAQNIHKARSIARSHGIGSTAFWHRSRSVYEKARIGAEGDIAVCELAVCYYADQSFYRKLK
jgi:hypothetical protein